MTFRAFRPHAAVLGVAFALGACTGAEPPPCPPVYILSDAKDITKFRPGPGQDLTDIVAKSEIVGFHGDCTYKERGKDWDVNLDLQVALQTWRGPAAATRGVDLSYFVAIPYFYPKDQAKAVFPVHVEFPEGADSVRTVDETVHLTIPVGAKDVISKYDVYLGFQTSPEELEHNRKERKGD